MQQNVIDFTNNKELKFPWNINNLVDFPEEENVKCLYNMNYWLTQEIVE